MTYSFFKERVRDTGAQFGVALDVLRPALARLQEAIRASGFFRTYTDHSMRHCEQMFAILGWLVPAEVQRNLTDPECALLVLAVYLHDLGMLTTQKEFDSRASDPSYAHFEQLYLQDFDPASQQSADHLTAQHFIFEEYIRHTHADRISAWITDVALAGAAQGQEMLGLLHSTPEAFRHYLGVICRSHHRNDLHDRNNYPPDLHLGNRPEDVANVQFLSICLRLADILHMSSDRTPPLEFRLVSPRNPVSAREWAMQLQVSGIGLSQADSSEIKVDAVCDDHRMYFYLRDFVALADAELQRCRSWLDSMPPAVVARYHLDARRVSREGLRAEGFVAERFELQLDQRRVIELLMGHNLYGDAKVAIRELVQNSIDAVRVRLAEDAAEKPLIRLSLSTKKRTLAILDNGIGMSLDVIRQHFLRVGDSYYRSPAFHKRCPNYTPISQFGIGFLTTFMLGEHATVVDSSRAGRDPSTGGS